VEMTAGVTLYLEEELRHLRKIDGFSWGSRCDASSAVDTSSPRR